MLDQYSESTVFVACSDPGGCEVIGRVLPHLRNELSNHLFVLLSEPESHATNLYQLVDRVKIVTDHLIWATSILDNANSSDLLIAGTSITGDFEKNCIISAKRHNIPTFSILDHWCHYKKRFYLNETNELCLPDFIFVPDNLALIESISEGIDPKHIVIAGHPVLGDLLDGASGIDFDYLSLLAPDKVESVLFVTEPIASSLLINSYLVNSDVEIASYVFDYVRKFFPNAKNLHLLHHPRENPSKYLDSGWDVIDRGQISKTQAIELCDVVVGIDSLLLIEAFLTGKPVFSISKALGLGASIGEKMGVARALLMTDVVARNEYQDIEQFDYRKLDIHRGASSRIAQLVTLYMCDE